MRLFEHAGKAVPDLARSPVLGGGAVGILILAAAISSGGDLSRLAITVLLALPLLATIATDLRARLVYPLVLLPGLLVALAAAAAGPLGLRPAVLSGLGAAAIAALLVLLCRWLWPETEETPLGGGEILIAATVGAMLGPERTPIVLFAGMVLGAAVAGALLLLRRRDGEDPIPYGACLCAAALVALVV